MTERRRNFRYDRVLIEAERILDPQVADAVVFLTGPQIEMLRNVTMYLNRLETYVDHYHLGYYVAPDATDYDEILAIVSDLEEKLMGNPNTIWGYQARYAPRKVEWDASAGTTTLTWDAVPAGKVYLVHRAEAKDKDSACSRVLIIVEMGSTSMTIAEDVTPVANKAIVWEGSLVLSEGDYLWARFYDGILHDEMYFQGAGYEMDVPE